MKNQTTHVILFVSLLFTTSTLWADREDDLIAILRSSASAEEKSASCLQLRIIGTEKAIPALAELLGEAEISQSARNALLVMPFSEADAALRAALNQTSGSAKVGIIATLGDRRDPESVALLTSLLSDSDQTIASAAATALGQIGNVASTTALSRAIANRSRSSSAALAGLLGCAERRLEIGDLSGAAALYRELAGTNLPLEIRVAAWRGLVLSEKQRRGDLMTEALSGKDRPIQLAAMKMIRQLEDPVAIKACASNWNALPADPQVAVLEAISTLGLDEALPTLHAARNNEHLSVRTATWQAFATINEPRTIAVIVRGAAYGELSERQAARKALARLHGPGVREEIAAQLLTASPQLKAELLICIGERREKGMTERLLSHANSTVEPVRLAALEALEKLAEPESLIALLNLLAASKSNRAGPIIATVQAVCEATENKPEATTRVVGVFETSGNNTQRQMLPVLATLGTEKALTVAQAATNNRDPELATEAIRVLGRWPDASAADHLLELGSLSKNPTVRVIALRGAIRVAALEQSETDRLSLLQKAIETANRSEEKKQALSEIGRLSTPDSLVIALKYLSDKTLVNEASLATVSIAERLAPSSPDLANGAAVELLKYPQSQEISERARRLKVKQ